MCKCVNVFCEKEKELSKNIESLLCLPTEFGRIPEEYLKQLQSSKRDKTRVVSYRVPANSCVQIYDYNQKTARVVFGPSLVMLQPDEQFTPLKLSGGIPKRPAAMLNFYFFNFVVFFCFFQTNENANGN